MLTDNTKWCHPLQNIRVDEQVLITAQLEPLETIWPHTGSRSVKKIFTGRTGKVLALRDTKKPDGLQRELLIKFSGIARPQCFKETQLERKPNETTQVHNGRRN